ncbi:MAG: helix-turn-helix domain-containing protein [Saprospiraceae bacterium]|nr:helix-turn-helix domain-containing protein [Saprospiraceae bacterium]
MARKAKEIEVSPEEIKELKSWVRSHTESRYSTRAQIILMSLDGKSLDEISKSLNITKAIVNKWRNRFRQNGLDGMDDLPRSGKPPVISAQTKASVIELACSKPEDGYTTWSRSVLVSILGLVNQKWEPSWQRLN